MSVNTSNYTVLKEGEGLRLHSGPGRTFNTWVRLTHVYLDRR